MKQPRFTKIPGDDDPSEPYPHPHGSDADINMTAMAHIQLLLKRQSQQHASGPNDDYYTN